MVLTLQADLEEIDDIFRHSRDSSSRLGTKTLSFKIIARRHTINEKILIEVCSGRKTDVPVKELQNTKLHRQELLIGVWRRGRTEMVQL